MPFRRLITTLGFLFAIVLVAGFITQRPDQPSSPTPSATSTEVIPTSIPDATWLTAVRSRIEGEEYRPRETPDGLQVPNRAQDFRTRFHDRGIDVTPRSTAGTPSWHLGWTTTRWGRRDGLIPVQPAPADTDGVRVTYRRDGLDEWYENRSEGLEQGFTIHASPGGSGSLCVVGHLDGALRPRLVDDQTAEFLDANGASRLRYGGLKSWDADGRHLPSRLTFDGTELAILVDDTEARYPITIDPLLSAPSWSYETNQAVAEFGEEVSTAGDVNGDGYSDIAVGADRFDSGQLDAGRVFVFLGSAGGLGASPAWTMDGTQLSQAFGSSVGPAGDVNGDGFDDLIVGSELYDNGTTDEGGAFLYLGSATGLALTPAWIGESNSFNVRYGCAVNTAGDVNGDGFADVIVGASSYDNDQIGEGRVFVYLGSGSGLSPTPVWTAESNYAGANYARSLGTAGDVNADGYADVIVGAPAYDNVQTNEGRAYVYHGSASGPGAAPAWIVEGNQNAAVLGESVGTAGDVNADGYADVIVSVRGYNNGQTGEGRAVVYLGSATGLATTPAWAVESNQANAFFGTSVATAGDVNADGYADVIVGASNYDNVEGNEGGAWVYVGSATGLGSTPYWQGESNQATAFYGIAVSTAGDVNGDGRSDILVGAYSWDNGQSSEGAAFVYMATPDSPPGPAMTPGWTGSADLPAGYGSAAACAGDVNGDGYSDIIVGASRYNESQPVPPGRVYAYYGSATGPATAPSWIVNADASSSELGYSVAGAGDVNGDGYSDVIVGALTGGVGGKVLVYHGSPSGLGLTPAWTQEGGQPLAEFGYAVGSAGDVNGDGYADVIIGAPGFDNGQTDEGRVYVYHGSAAGLGSVAAWMWERGSVSGRMGAAVGTAGDVNADGFSDVIVSEPTALGGRGLAHVLLGSASGLPSQSIWSLNGGLSTFFGISVGTAGDVNGDGYSDVIIGASGYSNGEDEEGLVMVAFGNAGGVGFDVWTEEGNRLIIHHGRHVATAGDVNRDGYSDIIVGTPDYHDFGSPPGKASIYYGSAAGPISPAGWTQTGTTIRTFGTAAQSAGDVNGDGVGDVIIGEPGQLKAYVYYGNGGSGPRVAPRQARADDSAPVASLGSSGSESSFLLKARGVCVGGRGRMEYEVAPVGTPFGDNVVRAGVSLDGGSSELHTSGLELSTLVTGLYPNTLYRWRLRIVGDTPYFPDSPWLSSPDNSPSEGDIRTRLLVSGVAENAAPRVPFRLDAGTPNPFAGTTRLRYSLTERGRVRLAVYDVTGREVAVLMDDSQDAGSYSMSWDGRGVDGREMPAGVYFARLGFGDRMTSQKLVLTR